MTTATTNTKTTTTNENTIMVIDMGGGTTDITYVTFWLVPRVSSIVRYFPGSDEDDSVLTILSIHSR